MRDAELRDLIASAMKGDSLAMEKLFTAYKDRIYKAALSIVADPDRADDVVQDVFLNIRRTQPQNAPTEKAGAWLIAVARNRAFSVRRKLKLNDLLAPDEEDFDSAIQMDGESNDTTVDDSLSDLDLHMDFQRALASLSELERRIVILKTQGYRHNEIAKGVGKKAQTVHAIYARALEK